MELLFPGLILVALMVWASTKIKRDAAAAFEPETIETDEFVIKKPDGFLHVVNDDSGLPFRAYSRDYGRNELNGDRQATIEVRIHPDSDLKTVSTGLESDDAGLSDVQTYIDGGENAMTFVVDSANGDPRRIRHYKLVTRGTNVLELCIAVLYAYRGEFLPETDETFANFIAK
jgi:hypothetical protein